MDQTRKRSTPLSTHSIAHNLATGLPPTARAAGTCGWLCALETKGNENNPSVSASDSRNDKSEVVAIGHFVEGKETSLDLGGLRKSQDNHPVDVCKCVYIG